MLELSMNQIMKHMGTNLILKDVNFNVYEGDRVGLIGANGSGKSTILKLIAGIIKLELFHGSWSPGYDYGFISLPRDAKVAYLDQMPSYDENLTVKEVLYLAFKDALDLEKIMRNMENQMSLVEGESLDKLMDKYSKVMHDFEIKGGYEMHAKVNKVCSGFGFSDTFLNQAFEDLSGGEKTTVELGKLLVHEPEILLLDEPTNHLDSLAIRWLEAFLKDYKGIVMIVSHDRYFLDQVTNKTLEIEDLTTFMYNGNFSKYKYLKDEKLRIQAADYKEQQKLIKSMKKQIQNLRQWAQQSYNNKFYQRAASIQIKLEKLEKIKRPVFERPNMRLSFKDQQRSGNEVIKIEGVSKAYDDKILLEDCQTMIYHGERIGLMGPNGCGKSTLVKMIMGEDLPDKGNIKLGANTKVAYLPQEITFEDESLSALEAFRSNLIIEVGEAREYLAKFMFYGKRVFTEVSGLSGGERIRLKLAMLLFHEVNVLILDEPTNHLDIDSIETLEEALEDFTGTLLFVSHDRYFTEKMSDRILAFKDSSLYSYDQLSDYTIEKEIPEKKKKVKVKIVKDTQPNYEKKIEEKEEDLLLLESQMDFFAKDSEKLNELYQKKVALEDEINVLYDLWTNKEPLVI